MPEVVEQPAPLVATRPPRLRLRTDRTELRDLAAEIDWAKAVLVDAGGLPGAAARGRPAAVSLDAGRTWPRSTPSTRRPSGATARSTSPTCC